jgi:NAD(P)-dependent dehydrogenase (short-subunit alcohol dehydrogenase family)
MTRLHENSVALVTGGGTGIGRRTAEMLAAAGAAVAVTGRRRPQLEATVRTIEGAGGRALAVSGDISDPAHAHRMVESTAEAFGGLHIVVNNAGIARHGTLEEMTDEDIDALVDIDLKGPIYLTRAALPHLRRHREALGEGSTASIINISSSVTFHPVRNFSVYSATKAGVDMLTRCWALDLAPEGIRVNAICPGIVATPIFETMMPSAAIDPALEEYALATPLGRVGEPRDVAHLALYLASTESGWMTGAILPLDGGLSLASSG